MEGKPMKEKLLELYEECIKEAKVKQKFVDLEDIAVKCVRKMGQVVMQDVLDIQGTGHKGKEIILEDGTKAKFKEYDKKNF